MVDWQLTAKTICCEAVDDEVILRAIREKSLRLKRPVRCQGGQCARVTEYKSKILAEETR